MSGLLGYTRRVTANVVWSDSDSAYILVDSARTFEGTPKFSHSLLDQRQHIEENGVAVEKGARKLLRLSENVAAGLCGVEADALDVVSALRAALATGRIDSFVHHLGSLPSSARFAVTVAVAGEDPPFNVFNHPQRMVFEVNRGHVHTIGSLRDESKAFIESALRKYLVSRSPGMSPEAALVAGLACATTMAVQDDLTSQCVGGVFFGGRLDNQRFFWQPDILYLLYDPGFDQGLERVPTPDGPTSSALVSDVLDRLELVVARVRDDVPVAASSLGMRGLPAWSTETAGDIQKWASAWHGELQETGFGDVGYFVFVPKRPGVVAVVPNTGVYVRQAEERFAVSDALVGLLRMPTAGKCVLKVAG